ncbi:hypothetical protein J6590_058197 [Homalodisca vitripennis]|nr:hypothetical protein J6590_058197 [Homalodisca vitripennis]
MARTGGGVDVSCRVASAESPTTLDLGHQEQERWGYLIGGCWQSEVGQPRVRGWSKTKCPRRITNQC